MSAALKILLGLGGIKMAPAETDGAAGGGGAGDEVSSNGTDFNPTPRTQLSGLYDDSTEEEEGINEDPTLGAVGSEGSEGDSEGDDGEEQTTGNESENDSDSDSPKYYFEGQEIEIQNDPEVSRLLSEQGFDIDKLNAEIYSEKGLTNETRQQLYDKFGKATVDLHLKSLETYNQSVLRSSEANEVSFAHRQQEMGHRATGGQLKEVMQWANDNLTADEYKKYRDNVNSENLQLAEMSLENLTMRYNATKSTNVDNQGGNKRPNLATGTTKANTPTSTVGLSQSEYMALFEPSSEYPRGKYYSDPKKFDELRELGRSRGR